MSVAYWQIICTVQTIVSGNNFCHSAVLMIINIKIRRLGNCPFWRGKRSLNEFTNLCAVKMTLILEHRPNVSVFLSTVLQNVNKWWGMATAKQLRLLSKTSESQVSFLSGLCRAQFSRRQTLPKDLAAWGREWRLFSTKCYTTKRSSCPWYWCLESLDRALHCVSFRSFKNMCPLIINRLSHW